uniref:Uncharacterized protein n=1 Tax=Molossus molossus TaxID=27622 RepID=A0A7J8BIR8_MOLMO|nr:hypothetical protein HJG59_010443 [Molossus molossus]
MSVLLVRDNKQSLWHKVKERLYNELSSLLNYNGICKKLLFCHHQMLSYLQMGSLICLTAYLHQSHPHNQPMPSQSQCHQSQWEEVSGQQLRTKTSSGNAIATVGDKRFKRINLDESLQGQ